MLDTAKAVQMAAVERDASLGGQYATRQGLNLIFLAALLYHHPARAERDMAGVKEQVARARRSAGA